MFHRVHFLAVCARAIAVAAQCGEAIVLNAVGDTPDPWSPPVRGPAESSGTFDFSGTGPDVDNDVVTEAARLRGWSSPGIVALQP